MLKHGYLINDPVMIQVNLVAIVLNAIYTCFYYKYATDKNKDILRPLGIGTAIVAVFIGYAQIESPDNLEFRYGLILTILMLLLLGAPLMDLVGIFNLYSRFIKK